jgi:hypothetical protein
MSLEKVGVTEYVFGGVFTGFVKTVHVQLSYETVDVSVPEELGENLILKFLDFLNGEFFAVG